MVHVQHMQDLPIKMEGKKKGVDNGNERSKRRTHMSGAVYGDKRKHKSAILINKLERVPTMVSHAGAACRERVQAIVKKRRGTIRMEDKKAFDSGSTVRESLSDDCPSEKRLRKDWLVWMCSTGRDAYAEY